MTVHHVVVYRWAPGTSAEVVAAIEAEVARLPGLVPSLRRYRHGPDLGLGEGRWDYGIVASFDDEEGWRAYDQHPEHDRVRTDVIAPHVADRAAIQIAED